MILNSNILKCPLKSDNHLLILHGLLGSNKNFLSLSKIIQKKWSCNIHLLDLRNHGQSFHNEDMTYPTMARDIKNYLNHHSIEQPNLIGHSMGGKAVMSFIQHYSNDIDIQKSVVVDILPRDYTRTFSNSHDVQDKTFQFLRNLQNVSFDDQKTLRSQINEAGAHFTQSACDLAFMGVNPQRTSFLFNINHLVDNYIHIMGWESGPCKIKKGLFIYGGQSNYIQTQHLDSLKEVYEEPKIKCVENAGHWLHAEQPSQFCNLVGDYLNE